MNSRRDIFVIKKNYWGIRLIISWGWWGPNVGFPCRYVAKINFQPD